MRFIMLFVAIASVISQVQAEVSQDQVNLLVKWECRGKWANDPDHAVGDKGLADPAYGCLQIRQPYVDDVNRHFGTKYRAEDCLGNRALSIWVFQRYMEIYATSRRLGHQPTFEDIARIHNGGPNGWKSDKTLPYWGGLKSLM